MGRDGLSAEGVNLVPIGQRKYDINCPLMGGPGLNYLATSCLQRLANKGCRMIGCQRYTAARRPVRKDPPPLSLDRGSEKPNGEKERAVVTKPGNGKTKHKIGPCKECSRVLSLPGRGLCGRCYSRALKAGGPVRVKSSTDASQQVSVGKSAPLTSTFVDLRIVFLGDDVTLFEKLSSLAKSSRRSVGDQVLFLIEEAFK